jgi:hypothetical protein
MSSHGEASRVKSGTLAPVLPADGHGLRKFSCGCLLCGALEMRASGPSKLAEKCVNGDGHVAEEE